MGWDTSPAGVPLTLTAPCLPVKSALSATPVPEKVGAEASSAEAPVITVLSAPLVGSVPGLKLPAVQLKRRVSFSTVVVSCGMVALGRVPTSSMLLTVSVVGVTLTLGLLTLPAGV